MKRTPYEDKAIKGTQRLAKVKEGQLATVTKAPQPQPYLTAKGKKIYQAICSHLIQHKLLCEIDSYYASSIAHNLDLYCRMAVMIEKAEKEVEGSGYFQKFQTGVVQPSPYFTTMNKAFDIFEKGCRNLGMTAKGRDSILGFAKTTKETEDPEDEFGLKALRIKNRNN